MKILQTVNEVKENREKVKQEDKDREDQEYREEKDTTKSAKKKLKGYGERRRKTLHRTQGKSS